MKHLVSLGRSTASFGGETSIAPQAAGRLTAIPDQDGADAQLVIGHGFPVVAAGCGAASQSVCPPAAPGSGAPAR
jgi:hypothetical protein